MTPKLYTFVWQGYEARGGPVIEAVVCRSDAVFELATLLSRAHYSFKVYMQGVPVAPSDFGFGAIEGWQSNRKDG